MVETGPRTALIAGAAGGLGSSIARRFMEQGWRVLAWDRSPIELDGVEATEYLT